MTDPDDRPGSDDPEDPSELLRLIGRTVPRSPHADERRTAPPPVETPHEPPADEPPADEPVADELPGTEPPQPGRSAPFGTTDDSSVLINSTETPAEDPNAPPAAPEESAPEESAPEEPAPEPEPTPALDTEPEPVEIDAPADDLDDDTNLEHALEALLLVVDSPIDEASLGTALGQTPGRVRQTLNRMAIAYTERASGIDLRRAGEGWRFYTRDCYAPYVEKFLLDGQRARLTRAALETLAVVAYRQPVTRSRVAAVRGVNCDGVLRTLLTRGLVEEAGTEEQTGGTLFRTTELFLERLGLSSVQELPPLAPLLPDIDAIDDLDGS
ncbi:SMC-Scp complex subunit ScpB [Pseudonocardia phyllosphaerae]|uniref:SMC-Scp complex subunit ScpB n=1 Tax=Pseudonocardia phyllosphaerae TaxID=3390502 RepID=UPI003978019A